MKKSELKALIKECLTESLSDESGFFVIYDGSIIKITELKDGKVSYIGSGNRGSFPVLMMSKVEIIKDQNKAKEDFIKQSSEHQKSVSDFYSNSKSNYTGD